jgi:hypothetical protein
MKNTPIRSGLLGILTVVCISIFLSRVLGGISASLPSETLPFPSNGEAAAKEIANRLSSQGFDSSLRSKEAVDFLLSPALLVQEALSDDVVLTYPTE